MERLFKMEILAIWSSACMSFWHISPREQQLNLARCYWPALRRELDIFGHQDYFSVMVTIYGFLLRISEPLSTKSTMNNSIFGYLDWIAIVLPPFPIPNSPGFLYCAYIHQLSLDWTSWPGYCPWYNLQIFRTSPLQNRWGVHYVSLSDYVWNNGESIYQSQSGCYKENNDRLRNFYDERLKTLPILIPNSPTGNCCPRPPNKVCELQAAIMPPATEKVAQKQNMILLKTKQMHSYLPLSTDSSYLIELSDGRLHCSVDVRLGYSLASFKQRVCRYEVQSPPGSSMPFLLPLTPTDEGAR